MPADIGQYHVISREINLFNPGCVGRQIRAGIINDNALTVLINQDSRLRRACASKLTAIIGIHTIVLQFGEQCITAAVIPDPANKIHFNAQTGNGHCRGSRWPSARFLIMGRLIFPTAVWQRLQRVNPILNSNTDTGNLDHFCLNLWLIIICDHINDKNDQISDLCLVFSHELQICSKKVENDFFIVTFLPLQRRRML